MKKHKHWFVESPLKYSGTAIGIFLMAFLPFIYGLVFALPYWGFPDSTVAQKSIFPICTILFFIFIFRYKKRVLYERSRNDM